MINHSIFEDAALSYRKGVALTFGVFDGIHIGHQAIINLMMKKAKAMDTDGIIITFDPHPALLTSGKAPPMITTIKKKIEVMGLLGVDKVMVEDFNEEFSRLSPEDFVGDILISKYHAQEIVVGYDCAFGKDRKGDKWLLKNLGMKYGYSVDIVDPYTLGGEIVSSTRVRSEIMNGDLELASRLLGRKYSIQGKVVIGKGIGNQIGHATANLQLENVVLPPSGVYAVRVLLDSKIYDGVLNMGLQPTFEESKFRVEVHLMNFDRVLYGKELEVFFIKKIRSEKRFKDAKELADQIEHDEKIARQMIINDIT